MNTAPFFRSSLEPAVFGELLHSLSQPLTTLRCSLELSLDDPTTEGFESNVPAALEQTVRVIDVVRLMQEYLDVEPVAKNETLIPVQPVLRKAFEQLSVLSEPKQLRISFRGACSAKTAIHEETLLKSFRYLFQGAINEATPRSGMRVTMHDETSDGVIRISRSFGAAGNATPRKERPDPVAVTLERTRVAIARRLLEGAGASVEIGTRDPVLLLRFPLW